MPENNLYYIYIDSKIEGTIDQLLSYFQVNILDANDCIYVYFKFYKDIEKYITQKLHATGIRYKFIRKNSDFSFEKNKVVFYLFNAQSNCRVVARRDLTHIFVTHGESHKLASIKPIIRIYDYVITSGQVGIERFLKAGIFNQYAIQQEDRVLKMGNTFIGQHIYKFDATSKALLYAPTWEGGVPEEDYSSLSLNTDTILNKIIQKNAFEKIYIQLHPNLGHRKRAYLKYLNKVIKKLKKLDISITIIKSNITLKDRWSFSGCLLKKHDQLSNLKIQAAVVDISAMEMQLLSERIPTIVLYREQQLSNLIIPSHIKHLYSVDQSIENCDFDQLDLSVRTLEIEDYYNYLIGYHEPFLEEMSFRERLQWLCHYATERKTADLSKSLDNY